MVSRLVALVVATLVLAPLVLLAGMLPGVIAFAGSLAALAVDGEDSWS